MKFSSGYKDHIITRLKLELKSVAPFSGWR